MNASIIEVGFMASVLGLMGLLLAVPAGFVSDRIGRRIPIFLGGFIWAISLVCMSISIDPYQMILSYAFAGIGIVLFDVALSASVGDISPSNRFGRSYGIYNAAIQAGFAAGPVAGAILFIQVGYRSTFLVTALFPLLATVMTYAARDKYTGDSVENATIPLSEYSTMSRGSIIVTAWITIFSISLLLGGVSVLVPLYIRFIGFSEVFIGVLFTFQSLAGAFGRFPFGYQIDNTGRVYRFMILGLLMMIMCTIGFTLSSWAWLLIMMVLFGLGLALAFMSASVNIARVTNMSNRGLAMGFASMFRFTGFMVGPWIGSIVVSHQSILEIGYFYGFLSLSALSLASIPIILLIELRSQPESRRFGSSLP